MLRCLIVDDNATFIKAATALLEREGVAVVGVASSIAEALTCARTSRPDVILVDIMLGSESGFNLARQLDRNGSAAPVILISTHAETEFAELIDQAPVVGFLPKSSLSGAAIRQLTNARPGR